MIRLFHSINLRKVLPWWNEIDWIRFDCCWRVLDIHGSCSRASGPDIVTFLGDIQEPQDIEILLRGRKARSYTQVLACLTTVVSQWRFMDSWLLIIIDSCHAISLPCLSMSNKKRLAMCLNSRYNTRHEIFPNTINVRWGFSNTLWFCLNIAEWWFERGDTVIQWFSDSLWLDWDVLNDIMGYYYGVIPVTVSGNHFPQTSNKITNVMFQLSW